MMNKVTSPIAFALLLVLFFALVLLNNQLLSGVRADLTQNQVYSLSDGSKSILQDIDEPINLYFFFSDKTSEGLTSLRNYANRVESLLKEYESAANGKLRLHVIDPEPFSEAEDQADGFGLTAAGIGPSGDAVYLGLAGRNALDDQQVISFFDPQKEQFLEYDISKMLYQLADPEPVKVGVISSLNMLGGQNPMTGQFDPPWTFFTQLQQLYSMENLDPELVSVPDDIDVLMLVHPKGLSDTALYAIDQFALKGGNVLAFVDPHHESDPSAAMGGMPSANASDLSKLFSAWGIDFNAEQILLDSALALELRGQDGLPVKHFGILGLDADKFDADDVITASLEVINGASFGSVALAANSELSVQPLLSTSENVGGINNMAYAMVRDPSQLSKEFDPSLGQALLAARFSGKAASAFDAEFAEGDGFVASTEQLNIVVVADSDLLLDRFWVQQSNFFGQTVITPFANNGDFVINAVENLGGNNALISIRSRGTFARPFDRVDALTVVAETKFREQEQLLQQQLSDTEKQLAELQGQQGADGMLVLNAQQQKAVDDFIDKKIEIRKALRDVRHQLDKDIESLGSRLKFINVALAPLLLVLLLWLVASRMRLRTRQ